VRPPIPRVSTRFSSPRLSQARTSHPSKFFPPKQPNCVTTVASFSPLFPPAVSSARALDHKALLYSGVRCRSLVLPPARRPILPWALFPFKALPSYSDALPKSSGASPPKRCCSGPRPPKRPRPGCAHTEVFAWQAEACPSQRLYSRSCLPRRTWRQCARPAGLPTEASLPLSFSSDLSCTFRYFPANSVGVLPGFRLRFKGHSEMRWRCFHASSVF